MRNSVGVLLLSVLLFSAGYLTASWRFIHSSAYILNEPIALNTSQGDGVLPKGTALHYLSMAHGYVDFYAFIRIPREIAMAKTQEAKVDSEIGERVLKYGAK